MRHLVPCGIVVLLGEGSGFESERRAAGATLGGSLNLSVGTVSVLSPGAWQTTCSVLTLRLTLLQP